jgi:two-component system, chemotaxis family, protein-glutamate methylesterase/glutaminase
MPGSNTSSPSPNNPIQVLLVDDSAVVRGLITRILQEDPAIKIVGSVGNGQQGIEAATKHNPDVIILDIEMPIMDGITALPLIIKAAPNARVIMCSTLTLRNAEITLKALSLGATDTIAKPTSAGNIIGGGDDFKGNLINLVKQICKAPLKRTTSVGTTTSPRITSSLYSGAIVLRDPKTSYQGKPSIVAIGSSTGGPQALFEVLKSCAKLDVPIVITQHMPATFTAMLATHIQQNTGLPCAEGKDGELLQAGRGYIAPGGFHMVFERDGDKTKIVLNTDAPENFCRPSVDPMFRSLANIYGNKVFAAILTGMGSDGTEGGRKLIDAGARLIAQDEATSVVWGMPGSVATNGLCHAVLPLADIGPMIKRTVLGV